MARIHRRAARGASIVRWSVRTVSVISGPEADTRIEALDIRQIF
jgi:hypothetical protein